MQTNIFISKSLPNFWWPQRKFVLRVKNYVIFEKWPQVTLLYEVCCRKIVEHFQNMQNVAVFRLICWSFKYLCPIYVRKSGKYVHFFSISAQYVRMSLKELLMQKSSRKWLCWVYLDTSKHFHSKCRPNYTGLRWNFSWGQKLRFWKMTPCYPTWWV